MFTNFCWLGQNLCLNYIQDKQNILAALAESLKNFVKTLKKFKEPGDLKHIYKNELDKACLDRDGASAIGKYLAKLIVSDKVMKDRPYAIALNCKYHRWILKRISKYDVKFFNKKIGLATKANVNEELAQELQKPVIKH